MDISPFCWHLCWHVAILKIGCQQYEKPCTASIFARLEKDIFPLVGGIPISEVTAPQILQTLRRIEARGAVDTAHRTLQNCSQIFRYAIATGRAERDPAADVRAFRFAQGVRQSDKKTIKRAVVGHALPLYI